MEKQLSYLVSNTDLERKFKSQLSLIKIMVYAELDHTDNIIDVLPETLSACFILLRTSENSGHWTCLCRSNHNIYYFDSYGIKPDGELSRIQPNLRYSLGESDKSLSRLLQTRPKDFTLSYNSIQFQTYDPDINTCGKWCYVFCRSIFKGLTIQEFQSRMKLLKQDYKAKYDNLVCILYTGI